MFYARLLGGIAATGIKGMRFGRAIRQAAQNTPVKRFCTCSVKNESVVEQVREDLAETHASHYCLGV